MEPKKLLEQVHDPSHFKRVGYELIDRIAQHLEDSHAGKGTVSDWVEPNDQLQYWQNYKFESPAAFFDDVLQKSINIHHPKYIGHQVGPTAPIAALTNLLSSILNNGMAVYEMGAVSSAVEKVVVQEMIAKLGWQNEGDGVLTSGGTLANLTALLTARQVMLDTDVWEEGLSENLAVMVSAEAHYCVDRALRIMGFGSKGIIKIPVDDQFVMRTDLLETCFDQATAKGLKVIAVVGSAPSTSTGMYDDLAEIAKFCNEKELWFHVDGAHGGAAIFSNKYKHLLRGIEEADSVVIDGHKMMMTTSIMTFLLYKRKQDSYATFSQKAQYLWGQSEDEEWFNLAKRTFECTKYMMSIQLFLIFRYYGEEVIDAFVTRQYDLANTFAQKLEEHEDFELALMPHSNIVCFRYLGTSADEKELDLLNDQICRAILVDGEFYIVKTLLYDKVYLRTTFMNYKTDEQVMDVLLEKIEKLGCG